MDALCLVSGGIDSTYLLRRLVQRKYRVYPLFINYGHKACKVERAVVTKICEDLDISFQELDVSGMGKIPSGLTDSNVSPIEDPYFPGRNLILLSLACSYAVSHKISVVTMGLTAGTDFADQSLEFIKMATQVIIQALGRKITILTPLIGLNKLEVIRSAKKFNIKISDTYSCYVGNKDPCNKCLSCKERIQLLNLPEFVNNF